MHYGRVNPEFEYHMMTTGTLNHAEKRTEEKDINNGFKVLQTHSDGGKWSSRSYIRRSFRYMNRHIFTQLYKSSLVRGYLEYTNTVWNPIKKTDGNHPKFREWQRR